VAAYVTTAEADQYFATRLYADAWTGATELDKQKALETASRQIDRLPLKGRKTDTAQIMAFPRYPDTEVPQAVKDACCEQALFLLSLTEYERHRNKQHVLGVVGGSVGDANEYAAESLVKANRAGTILCPEARELLRPWLAGSVAIV
jgi:hypothetical protein